MLSSLFKYLPKALFIGLWCLFAAEIFLRVFDPQPMLPRYVMGGDFGIRVNTPNQVYTHTTPEYKIEIQTNANGMRANYDQAYPKPAGTMRIVVLSDSFGMGYGVSLQNSFTEIMRSELQQKLSQPVEVINLSVSGYGTAEQLLMLQNEGIKYQPDLVLLTWHATDPGDNLRSGLFEYTQGQLKRKNMSYLPGVKIREFLFSFAAYRWMAGNSHFYNWIRDFAGSKIKRMLSYMQSTKPAVPELPTEKAPDYSLSLALLTAVKEEAEKAGAKLLLLEIPIRASRSSFEPSMPEEIKQEFDYLSPIQAFEQHPGELLYWEKSHGHFTPLGCKIVGELLADQIAAGIKDN